MNIEPSIVVTILAGIIGLQAWTLSAVVELKTKVAAIAEHCRLCGPSRKEPL